MESSEEKKIRYSAVRDKFKTRIINRAESRGDNTEGLIKKLYGNLLLRKLHKRYTNIKKLNGITTRQCPN